MPLSYSSTIALSRPAGRPRVLAANRYCMNDPTKTAPFFCHAPCEDGDENQCVPSCNSDADCPLSGSYCMTGPGTLPPYVCHVP